MIVGAKAPAIKRSDAIKRSEVSEVDEARGGLDVRGCRMILSGIGGKDEWSFVLFLID